MDQQLAVVDDNYKVPTSLRTPLSRATLISHAAVVLGIDVTDMDEASALASIEQRMPSGISSVLARRLLLAGAA